MSEKHPSDVKVGENADGTVSFATDVVATIAGLAANEVEGVASMPSTSSGFADILSRKNSRNFTKGVRIDIDGGKVAVDVTIVVEYGSPIPDVARSIQENVKKAIETMSGLDVRNVDVHVQGVSFERENRAAAELQEQQQKMLEQEAARKEEQMRTAVQSQAEEEQPAEEAAEDAAPVEADDAVVSEEAAVEEEAVETVEAEPVEQAAEEEADEPAVEGDEAQADAEAEPLPAEEDEGEYELALEDITDEELEEAIREEQAPAES